MHRCAQPRSYAHVLSDILYFKTTITQSQGLVLPNFLPGKIKARCLHDPSNYILKGFIGTGCIWDLEVSKTGGDMEKLHIATSGLEGPAGIGGSSGLRRVQDEGCCTM